VIHLPGNAQRIDRWTDTPELTEAFYRESGAYVFTGGQPQPVFADIDTTSAFASRR
jgi:hypothetical protein